MKVDEAAKGFVKANKQLIKEQFAGDAVCSSDENPLSIFMAGSPGAGKTELSKWFLKVTGMQAVRIDADEIRDFIPQYNGSNAAEVQGASALGVEYLYDHALKKKKNLILDATFADFEKSRENVARSVKKGRHVEIFYIQQEPQVAWEFTQAREKLEGRIVPKDIFIDSFLAAPMNVNKVKKEFGKDVQVNVVVKNFENGLETFKLNVDSLDPFLPKGYNRESLMEIL